MKKYFYIENHLYPENENRSQNFDEKHIFFTILKTIFLNVLKNIRNNVNTLRVTIPTDNPISEIFVNITEQMQNIQVVRFN